jgi:hypothetical protein
MVPEVTVGVPVELVVRSYALVLVAAVTVMRRAVISAVAVVLLEAKV